MLLKFYFVNSMGWAHKATLPRRSFLIYWEERNNVWGGGKNWKNEKKQLKIPIFFVRAR
jgi:hypothetical protein